MNLFSTFCNTHLVLCFVQQQRGLKYEIFSVEGTQDEIFSVGGTQYEIFSAGETQEHTVGEKPRREKCVKCKKGRDTD